MKLSQLLEVRYDNPTNGFVVTWPNDDWNPGDIGAGTYYAFGTTQAKKGFYVRSDQLVAVQRNSRQAIEKMKDSMLAWEQGMYGDSDGLELEYEKRNVDQYQLDEISQSLERGERGGWDYFKSDSFVDFMMVNS